MKKTQEKLSKFLTDTKLEEITLEEIKKIFPNIEERDEETELYLSHCLVDQKYDEDKVIKLLEILFGNGLDPNQKGYGGYTFITQALYGAEQEEETLDYPLSFFERIIPLAKKYGYDVNIKDEDGDTLIHSAIYSEDYYESIEPLIYLLGENFDITTKNNAKESITDALNNSIKAAVEQKNEKWLNQLINERESIRKMVESKKGQKISQLIEESSTDDHCFKIESTIKSDNLETEKQNQLLQKAKDKEEITTTRKAIETRIQALSLNSSLEECKEIERLIQNSILPKEEKKEYKTQVTAMIGKINYQQFLEQLKREMNNIQTIVDIEVCLKKIPNIQDEEFRNSTIERLNEEIEKARQEEEKFDELYKKVKVIQDSEISEICTAIEEDLENIIVHPPKNKNIKKINELNQKMELIIEEATKKIEELKVAEFKRLIEKGTLLDTTLGTSIIDQVIQSLNSPKEKIKVFPKISQ
ncbi:MAG: hypothetical protein HFG40_03830 [Bacilli bacterium]|nr:hypothetical protein [Bacilli bacterium]